MFLDLCWETFSSHLVTFLVKSGRHLQQGAALVQRRGEGLPLLLQLAGDLLDLLGGVVARLQQPVAHRHDAVDVHVHVLREKKKKTTKWANGMELREELRMRRRYRCAADSSEG